MPFKRRFKDKYAGSSPENASFVRTLFDLLFLFWTMVDCSGFSMFDVFRATPTPPLKAVFGVSFWCWFPALFSAFRSRRRQKATRRRQKATRRRHTNPRLPSRLALINGERKFVTERIGNLSPLRTSVTPYYLRSHAKTGANTRVHTRAHVCQETCTGKASFHRPYHDFFVPTNMKP